jgi:hypothetical protein
MKLTLRPGPGAVTAAVLAAVLCQSGLGQGAQSQDAPGKDAKAPETKGLHARATPGDYQANAQIGAITLAAEFTGHSVNTPGAATLATEDYVVVEVGFLGPPEAHVTLSQGDFSLRINGKKPLLAQSYLMLLSSLKDPEWVAPEETEEKKGSTSIGGGGAGQNDAATPKVYHPPFALARQWQQIAQKASLPEGERGLPAAGLIFFKYHGKSDDIDTMELTYKGSAGKAVLKLHP